VITAVDAGFVAFGAAAVVAGWRVFRTDSMVRAAFLLLASFLAVAGVLFLLASEFLGGITILMMTGEMVLMAVFMVMFMMNPGGLMPMTMVHQTRFAAALCSVIFVGLCTAALTTGWVVHSEQVPEDVTYAIGEGMMEEKMLVFLTAGVTLLACMIASLALALHRGRYDRYGDGLSRSRAVDPGDDR
jgi:NADH-quinone oxidoreductase subunit J